MSGKDQSVVSKEALMSTKPGKQIIKQGLFKSKGYKLFNKYKEEAENEFPNFAERFTDDLLKEIKIRFITKFYTTRICKRSRFR